MRIVRIEIENYRSIKDITLQPGSLAALVGANNAGKTNILSALNFALGDRWPSSSGLQPTDRFNKDASRNIRIKIAFSREGNDAAVAAISISESNGRLYARYRLFDRDETAFLNDAIRSQFPIVYLDAARNFDSQFSMSRWSLFGRIARQLHDDFEATAPHEVKTALTGHLNQAQDILRTPLYRSFEAAISEAFQSQIRRTMHNVRLDFRSFDPLNFYKAIYPTLIEGQTEKSPAEAGSGMRNLIVLALFRAYATAFRHSTVFAVEEPEIYLHPHAQRSLAALYREMAAAGHQVFYSTHSAAFVDVTRSDEIVLVDRCEDEEEEICTQVRTVTGEAILAARQALHPGVPMSLESVRAKLSNISGTKHAEAYFAKAVLLAEGPSEEEVYPIFARHMCVDFDGLGISVIGASGKGNLDSLWQLYRAHEIPVFLTFDNDQHSQGKEQDRALNEVLTRMLGLEQTRSPAHAITDTYAILQGDLENVLERETDLFQGGLYAQLKAEAQQTVGRGKPLVARYIARGLVERGFVPPTIVTIIENVRALASGV